MRRPDEFVSERDWEDAHALDQAEDAFYSEDVDWDVWDAHQRFRDRPVMLASELARIGRERRMRWFYRPGREDA